MASMTQVTLGLAADSASRSAGWPSTVLLASMLVAALLPASPAASQHADAAAPSRALDASRLPVSIERVQRSLASLPPRSAEGGLRLDFVVDVYAMAPRIDILGSAAASGASAVQYGPMTHNEFVAFVTPKYLRAPVVNVGGLMSQTAAWAARRAAERQREAERRRGEAEARRARERDARVDGETPHGPGL